ncbi:NACHT domain-containing protein [Oligoflexus tunisiensis]|uniref:NACHT domain-containing protein n=1 Tax=Oligoflexus tunisiensis TaxID=708132 RepID=UPI00114D29A3|nr:hypothetical protein [Oligoflexus tunisiensis]
MTTIHQSIERLLIKNNDQQDLCSFDACFSKNVIILLGNPGDGKSTLFRDMAKREPNGEFVTIRKFLTYAPERWRGKVLYLDGLDEEKGRTSSGSGTIGEICERIESLGTPKFRISCRSADWYGDFDLSAFTDISEHTADSITLRLRGFSDDDIRSYLRGNGIDPENFVTMAKKAGISELLRNPLNLELISSIVKKSGSWPSTKIELYGKAVAILISEENTAHRIQKTYATNPLLEQAEELCALQMLSNVSGFALDSSTSTTSYPAVVDLVENYELAKAALSRRIFKSESEQVITPYHRTISEFLAAKYITRRIKAGLPIGRALALITGTDGGVLSEFRGLSGWLATLSLEFADILIRRDPLGILVYGDMSKMPPNLRINLLQSLDEAAVSNPYFRSGYWERETFAPLAAKPLAKLLKSKLADHTRSSALTSCILDALASGEKLPELKQNILNILYDPSSADAHMRALRALIHMGTTSSELKKLIDSVNRGEIPDADQELRGHLLFSLYPETINEKEIADYLVQRHQSFFGTYYRFLTEAAEITPNSQLPALMDSIVSRSYPRRHSDSITSLFGRILLRILKSQGQTIATKRLFGWLSKTQDRYGDSHMERDERHAIKSWFEANQSTLWKVIDFWLSNSLEEDIFASYSSLMNSVCRAEVDNFSKKIEQRLQSLSNGKKIFMFERLIGFSLYQHRPDALTIEELFAIAEKDPTLSTVLSGSTSQLIQDWRIKDNLHANKAQKKRFNDLKKTRKILDSRMGQIESGDDIDALVFLANHYLGNFTDSNRDHSPAQRIEIVCSLNNIPRVMNGFVAFTSNESELPDPSSSGELACENKSYNAELPLLVGMDLLWSQDPAGIDSLPHASIRAAAVCAVSRGGAKDSEWVQALLEKHKATCLDAIVDYFRPQLLRKLKVSGLNTIEYDQRFYPIRSELILKIFSEFTSCHHEAVETLLRLSIEIRLDIISFLPSWAKGSATDPASMIYIEATEFLHGRIQINALNQTIGKDRIKASKFREFIENSIKNRDDFKQKIEILVPICQMLGSIFKYSELDPRGSRGDEYDSANFVSWSIETLAKQIKKESIHALNILKKDLSLESWHNFLSHALESQARLVRDSGHNYPSIVEIAKTLANSLPANISDFHALVTDHATQLRNRIENGSSDLKLAFWNTDRYGKATEPKIENLGRDTLLEHLKSSMQRLGVTIEAEGNYVDDNRSDMKTLFGGAMNIPIEVKRHYHLEVWSAAQSQLIEKYVIDPDASGYGIYIVLWYGIDVKRPPSPPPGIAVPTSAVEMEKALVELIPIEHRSRISILVIDCKPTNVSTPTNNAKKAVNKKAANK